MKLWPTLRLVCRPYGGIFDYEGKRDRLDYRPSELETPEIWKNPTQAQELGRERSQLEEVVQVYDQLEKSLQENTELLDLVKAENDVETFAISHR